MVLDYGNIYLGRGNSYIDMIDGNTWVENTIEFPSIDDANTYNIDLEYILR